MDSYHQPPWYFSSVPSLRPSAISCTRIAASPKTRATISSIDDATSRCQQHVRQPGTGRPCDAGEAVPQEEAWIAHAPSPSSCCSTRSTAASRPYVNRDSFSCHRWRGRSKWNLERLNANNGRQVIISELTLHFSERKKTKSSTDHRSFSIVSIRVL